ncbi:MAG: hypothetical protein ACTMIR_01425 [Cellulomonadaceae bacterium]
MDERGIYFPDNISGPNDGQYVYDIQHPVTGQNVKRPSRGWVSPRNSLEAKIAEGRVHFGPDHTTVPNLKTYLANTEYQSLTSIRYVDGRAASKRLATLFGEKVFTNPKDEFLLRDIYRAVGVSGDDIVLDMFAGSGSAMQAVLELNGAESMSCRFIGIQVAEDLNESLKTAKGAAKQITTNAIRHLTHLGRPATVAEITKQRMRLAHERFAGDLLVDSGFRVLRVDSSNLVDTLAVPDGLSQDMLSGAINSVRSDRDAYDLLFQVLIDWALDLSEPVVVEQVDGREILSVAEGALVACFSGDINPTIISEVARRQPLRAVFLDSGFATDAARINAEQVFREVSPATEVRAI